MVQNKSDEEILKDVQSSVVGASKNIAEDSSNKSDENQDESKKEDKSDDKKDEKPAGDDKSKEEDKSDEEDKDDKSKSSKDEDKSDDEDDAETGKEKRKGRPERYIPQDQYNKRKEKWDNDLKTANEGKAKAEQELADLKVKFEELQNSNLSKEEKDEVNQEITEIATELGIDVSVLNKLEKVFLKKAPTLSKEDRELLDSVKNSKANDDSARLDREESEFFKGEWATALPEIKKVFPNSTPEKEKEAFDYMDKLAHTQKYGNLSLNEIFDLKKKEFEKILSVPKRDTFEEGGNGGGDDKETDLSTMNIADMTPKQLIEYEKKYRSSMPEKTTEVNRNGNVTRE